MNKVFKVSLAASLACLSLYAEPTSKELLNKINALQKQVKELQKKQAEQNAKKAAEEWNSQTKVIEWVKMTDDEFDFFKAIMK